MRIVFFGRYEPHHARPHILMEAARVRGHDVVDYSTMSWARLLLNWLRLLFTQLDAVIVTGKPALLLAQPIRLRVPVLFDIFISDYQNLVVDRKRIPIGSIRAKLLARLDKISVLFADVPFLDTEAHRSYFERSFGISAGKIKLIPIGALASRTQKPFPKQLVPFRVLFYGSFIPLHGIDVMLDAAKLLKDELVEFDFCGKGQLWQAMADRVAREKISKVTLHGFVPSLDPYVERAHVVLGVFSGNEKSKLMIQTKTLEAMSYGKAIITMACPGVEGLLKDGENALLIKPRDPRALADAIMRLLRNTALAEQLGNAARKTFEKKLSAQELGRRLEDLVHSARGKVCA